MHNPSVSLDWVIGAKWLKGNAVMQHSQLIENDGRSLETWVDVLWITEQEQDKEYLQKLLSQILEHKDISDRDYPDQPSGLDVAETLLNLGVDQATLIASLFSDPYFYHHFDKVEVQAEFGEQIAVMADNMHTLQDFTRCIQAANEDVPDTEQQAHAEQLRRMLLAIVKDVRVVLIKLVWQLQNLRLLSKLPISRAHIRLANQTLNVYSPLASRLGISQIKWEMEDLAFRFKEPIRYKEIAKALANRRIQREEYIAHFITLLRDLLDEHGIQPEAVYGRPKHIYSIWRKMKRKNLPIDQLYDLRAVRVIVDDMDTCYRALSLVHDQWHYLADEYDDYIHNRKPNGYQSIHTVVLGPMGRYVEIQIRTREMHSFAEFGVASHWRYKEGGKGDSDLEYTIASLRRLLEQSGDSDEGLMEDFHREVFSDSVFVFTPKGRVIELVKGATPIDFAYAIHTDIGHRCQGAKANGVIVPLNYELKNAQQVEVLTGKEPDPKMNWLNPSLGYIKSARTRNKINHWFRQQDHEKNAAEGRALFEREKHLLNLPNLTVAEMAKQFGRQNERDFLIALGRGDISYRQFSDTLLRSREQEIRFRKISHKQDNVTVADSIEVGGVKDLFTQVAQCCKPVHGDEIVGYITQGRGVMVHRGDCPNILNLSEAQKIRLVDVGWGGGKTSYAVDILVAAYNETGLLRDITDVLYKEQIAVMSINTRPTHNQDYILMDLTIQIEHTGRLLDILERLMQIPAVTDVQRRVS